MAGMLLAALLTFQTLHIPKLITGVVVNAVFIIAFLIGGLRVASVLALMSPVGAIVTGHLPAPLMPFVPLIAVGNILFVRLYARYYKRHMIMRYMCPVLSKAFIMLVGGLFMMSYLPIDGANMPILWIVLGIQVVTGIGGIFVAESCSTSGILPRNKGLPKTF